MKDKNVRINGQIHHDAVQYTQSKGLLLGKFVDLAIAEKIARDKVKSDLPK